MKRIQVWCMNTRRPKRSSKLIFVVWSVLKTFIGDIFDTKLWFWHKVHRNCDLTLQKPRGQWKCYWKTDFNFTFIHFSSSPFQISPFNQNQPPGMFGRQRCDCEAEWMNTCFQIGMGHCLRASKACKGPLLRQIESWKPQVPESKSLYVLEPSQLRPAEFHQAWLR